MFDDTVSKACRARMDKSIERLKEQRRSLTPEQRVELNERLIRDYQQKLKDLMIANVAFIRDEAHDI